MFPFRKRYNSSRWEVYLIFLLLTLGLCHDPNPGSLRRSAGTRDWSNVADSEEGKPFYQATVGAQQTGEHEGKSGSEGRIVSEKHRIPDSTHEQAAASSLVHQGENRQMVFQEASNILAEKYKFTSKQLALRKRSVASALDICNSNERIECNATARYRTANGTCNNLENPTWGSAGSCFLYLVEPVDGGFRSLETCGNLPPPRKVSVNVHSGENEQSDHYTFVHVLFGQFLAHDIALTPVSKKENGEDFQCCSRRDESNPLCAAIHMIPNDRFFPKFNITCLNFVRSASCQDCKSGKKTLKNNTQTSFIDGSMIYGTSDEEIISLRANNGTGKLLVQSSPHGDLLPKNNEEGGVECSSAKNGDVVFRAGDSRVNQHGLLAMFHTLWLREHNRIAEQLRTLNPHWDGEKVFHETRKIIGAVLQWITYNEYLPLIMSPEGMDRHKLSMNLGCTSYNPNINPSLYTDFSACIFRFAHTMITAFVTDEGLQLRDLFSNNTAVCEGKMDNWLRGMTRAPAKPFNKHMVDDVTKFLYRTHGEQVGGDLASTDVQRGRDHGLQGYVNYVEFCSQRKIRTWEDLVLFGLMTENTTQLLRCIYRSPAGIDLYTGMVCEIPNEGQMTGPTAICIIGLQFHNLKYGDRFFFNICDPHRLFTEAQLQEIRKYLLATVLCRNSNVTEVQQKTMETISESNPVVPCGQIPKIDFTLWKE